MTKKLFISLIDGKMGYMSYPNGNKFIGKIKVYSKEFVLDGLHVQIKDVKKMALEEATNVIVFDTENGTGRVLLDDKEED